MSTAIQTLRPPFDAQTLADLLGGTLNGENRPIIALVSPQQVQAGGIAIVDKREGLERLRDHSALPLLGALVTAENPPAFPCPIITVAQPRIALAQLTALFVPQPADGGVSEHARIDPSAVLAADVSVGVGTVISAGVTVGAGTRIGAGCIIGEGCTIGEGCVLHASVTLYRNVTLSARVILHSGVVLGADGFGYAFGPQGALKIHHLGSVVLEDDVEVGANSCIDRATLGETRIGSRTKIDNLCQIGHNVVTGSDCVIAGGAAIGGSTVLGRGVFLGGSVAVTDHVTLGDGVRVVGRSSVTKSVPTGETWAGYPAKPQRKWVRELYLLGRLDGILNRLESAVLKVETRD